MDVMFGILRNRKEIKKLIEQVEKLSQKQLIQQENIKTLQQEKAILEAKIDHPPLFKVGKKVKDLEVISREFKREVNTSFLIDVGYSIAYGISLYRRYGNKAINKFKRPYHHPYIYKWEYVVKDSDGNQKTILESELKDYKKSQKES